jgi:hypothetical protein
MAGRKLAFTYQRKSTVRAAVRPRARDIEWAAGFIEGEGNFRGEATNEQVIVGQVQKEPLLKLQRLFGGSVRPRTMKPAPDGCTRSQLWLWVVCGARARGVMLTLYSLMSPRRQQQIQTALEGV